MEGTAANDASANVADDDRELTAGAFTRRVGFCVGVGGGGFVVVVLKVLFVEELSLGKISVDEVVVVVVGGDSQPDELEISI